MHMTPDFFEFHAHKRLQICQQIKQFCHPSLSSWEWDDWRHSLACITIMSPLEVSSKCGSCCLTWGADGPQRHMACSITSWHKGFLTVLLHTACPVAMSMRTYTSTDFTPALTVDGWAPT